MVVGKGRGREWGVTGQRAVSVGDDKRVLELGGGDGHTTVE